MPIDIVTPMRVGVVLTLAVAVGFGVSLVGRDRLWTTLTGRFIYGIPWGSLVVVTGVFAFYLFAQSGLHHWDDPVTLAFRNWAYLYPTGMVTSGFAHASPSHLLGNMLATVVLAPLAEFIWGHYPHQRQRTVHGPADTDPPSTPAPAEFDGERGEETIPGGNRKNDAIPEGERREESNLGGNRDAESTPRPESSSAASPRWYDRPVIRALVIFPGIVLIVSLVTSLYALGWSLGFSGTVFAFLGFVLLRYPIPTAVALLVVSLVNTLVTVLAQPVLTATAEAGPPAPPGWAGVNVQAHLLGFLIGVSLALVILWAREEQPDGARLLLATVLVGVAQGLWQLSTTSGSTFIRYQALGVIFVLLLAVLITYVTVAENVELSGWAPKLVRAFAALWIVATLVGAAGAVLLFDLTLLTMLALVAVVPAVVLPAVVLVVPDFTADWPVTTRRLLFASLVVLIVVIALPSAVGNAIDMADDSIPDGAVAVEDYHVSYAENVSHGRTGGNNSGLIVVSEDRYVWSVAVTADRLEHDGEATVPVGGVGWRETVDANRTSWSVLGNDSVYAVDLETDDEMVRSFTSESSEAAVDLAGNRMALAPGDEEFTVTVTRDGETVESVPIPAVNETVTAGNVEFKTTEDDGKTALIATVEDSRIQIAEKD